MLNEQQFYLFGQIQTCQTGGQLYRDISPYGECSLEQGKQGCRCGSKIALSKLEQKSFKGNLFRV